MGYFGSVVYNADGSLVGCSGNARISLWLITKDASAPGRTVLIMCWLSQFARLASGLR
jgi:hypothetical protein